MNSRLSFALALCMGVLVFSHADADHHKKKNKDNNAQLQQCTIQSSGSGMGCVAPLKLKCEKMKNGKKCCGCVGDKNAKTQQPPEKTAQPQAKTTKTLCHTLLSDKVVEVFKNQCATDHPGADFNCGAFDTSSPTEKRISYRCCCYYQE
jgi:hypothetical protein